MGNSQDPITLHKYLYAGSNPAMFVDPSGKFFTLGGFAKAASIASTLASVATTTYDVFQIATGEKEFSAVALGTEILLSRVGGRAAQQIINLVGKKGKEIIKKGYDTANCFFNSFPEGTLVNSDIGLIPIESIKIGDKVLAYNEDTQQTEYQLVTHLIQNEQNYNFVSLELENGEILEATPGHPFYVNAEWKSADELEVTDELKRAAGTVGLKAIGRVPRYEQVYNITVDVDHSYYVGTKGTLVHNSSKGKGCKFRGLKAKGFQWDDILRKHSPTGRTNLQRTRANHTEFTGLTDKQIKARVKAAWKNRELRESQFSVNKITGREEQRMFYEGIDPKSGARIGIWFNTGTRLVETAYPL